MFQQLCKILKILLFYFCTQKFVGCQWIHLWLVLQHYMTCNLLYNLCPTVFEKINEINLCQMLKTVKIDVFYLAYIFNRFYNASLQLQGSNKNLICRQMIMSLFIDKLELLCYILLERGFHHFTELSSIKVEITPDDIDRISSHSTN